MNKREIFLDFTSLLDVTLIVIFFFVLFSHLDSEENRLKTEAEMTKYEVSIAEAQRREAEAEQLKEQLEDDIELVIASNERLGKNNLGIAEYRQGKNIKIIVDITEDSGTARILKETDVMGVINVEKDTTLQGASAISKPANEATKQIAMALESAGYKPTDTIFCDLVFDSSIPGSYDANEILGMAIDTLRKDSRYEYKFLYSSITDMSIGKE